jgi:hypothetical protein
LNSTNFGMLAFGCTLGAGLLAMLIRDRLPAHHVEGDSRETVKLVLGLIATLTAMVLGLLISSAHSSYDAQETALQQVAVHVYQLDRILGYFGQDASKERKTLHELLEGDIARIWPGTGGERSRVAPQSVQQEMEDLFRGISDLPAKTEAQHFAQNRALQLLVGLGETRLTLIEQSQGDLSKPFLFVLISWATILFFGFGLISRYNQTVVVALFVGAVSVAGAIFLILQLNKPYGGWMEVSSAPLTDVLAQIGH